MENKTIILLTEEKNRVCNTILKIIGAEYEYRPQILEQHVIRLWFNQNYKKFISQKNEKLQVDTITAECIHTHIIRLNLQISAEFYSQMKNIAQS